MPSVDTDQPQKPVALKVAPERIPLGLQVADSWVLWKYELRANGNGASKWTKPPYQPDGHYAKSTDATTWSSFSDVIAAYHNGNFAGIGRVFTIDDPYVVVDLDHCRDPNSGVVAQGGIELIRLLRSYTEVSPSGTGIRMVVRAKLPPGSRNRKGNIEIYDDARYCTLTGHLVEGAVATVEPRQAEVEQFLVRVFGEEPKPHASTHNGNGHGGAAPNLDDAALLELARKARNGDKFLQLFDCGDWQGAGYNSQSEGDLALCGMLGFWFGGDPTAIDRAFRSSALMREKWDRPEYRQDTITAALSGRTEFYDPNRRQPNENGEKAETPEEPAPDSQSSEPRPRRTPRAYLSELEARQARRAYWEGILYAGDVVGIFGRALAGKTSFAASLALALTNRFSAATARRPE